MQDTLLATARPYLQFLALLTLAPPPSSQRHRPWPRLLQLLYACYALAVLALGVHVTRTHLEVSKLIPHAQLDRFSCLLSYGWKISMPFCLAIIYLNVLLQHRRVSWLYVEIATLERQIATAAQPYGGAQHGRGCSFRWRLALRCGLPAILLVGTLTGVTLPTLSDYLSWPIKLATLLIGLLLQLYCVIYCVHVQLVEELLRRLRRTLRQLQLELAVCNRSALLQALCLALRQNQLLLARIWRLVEELQAYILLPMLSLFLSNGMLILHLVNWFFIQSLNSQNSCHFCRLSHVLVLLANLLLPCWLSHCCINTYNSFACVLHNVHCVGAPLPLIMRLREYALQLQHLKLRFTCGGLFDINLKYFGALMFTLATYIIILIQFKLQANIEAKRATKLHFH